MTYVTPTASTLALFLGVDDINEARATLLLTQAENLAKSVVNPLPDGAEAVVLSASARAFVNPAQTTSQTAGPFNIGTPFPGVYLTRSERRALRQLSGKGGGAFTIDPTPADAMAYYRDPLEYTLDDAEHWSLDHPEGV